MTETSFSFLAGGGEIGKEIRQHNWAQTLLGNPDQWPHALRTILSFVLNSPLPMAVWWGPDLIQFCNDAMRQALHPEENRSAAPGSACLKNDDFLVLPIRPAIDSLMNGGPAILNAKIYSQQKTEDLNCTYSLSPLKNDEGLVEGLLAICTEIQNSKRERDREFYIPNNNQLRNLVLQAPVGICVINADTLVAEIVNNAFVEIAGKPYETIIGSPYWDTFAEVASAYEEKLQKVISKGEPFYADEVGLVLIRNGKAEAVYVTFAYEPMKDRNGTVEKVVIWVLEHTTQVTARQKVEASEARFRTLLEEAPMATCLFTGRELTITLANEQMLQSWGKTRAVIGKTLREALPELHNQSAFFDILDNVFVTGETYRNSETSAQIEVDGKIVTYYYDYILKAVRNEAGEIYGIINTNVNITEQVLARQNIIANEARFRLIVEQAPMAVGMLEGRDMIITLGNAKIFEVWGKPATITGQKLIDALPELEGQPFMSILENVFDTGDPYFGIGMPARLNHNGNLRDVYFDFTYAPIRNAEGKVAGIMILATEVTDRELAMQAVVKSEARFRSLIEQAPVATCLFTGRDQIIAVANDPILRFWGKGNSVIGKPLAEALPELKSQPFLKILDDVYTSGKPYSASAARAELEENGIMHTYYFNFTYKPLFNDAGEVYGVLDMAVDVTDQVMAQEQVESARKALHAAIEMAELGTWTIDIKTGNVSLSRRLQNWLGTEELHMENDPSLLVHAEDRARVSDAFAEALSPDSNGRFDQIFRVVHVKSGNARWIHAAGQTQKDALGMAQMVEGTAQDVSIQQDLQTALEAEVQLRTEELASVVEELRNTNADLKESNVQLAHSNDELSQYAYVASHDLQEPLRKIRFFTSLLAASEDFPEPLKKTVDKISASSERMTLLIQDLLSFSRLLRSDMLMRPVQLEQIVTAVWNDFELTVEEKKATIRFGDLPVLQAVNLQMNQLFYNLISNALKFVEPGKHPHISVTSQLISHPEVANFISNPMDFSTYHHIIVQDNGIGFETQYNEQIFEVFKRLHGRSIYPGSGIGLAMCRRIVANHKGFLYATSDPNKGSTFHIILPDKQAPDISQFPDENPMIAPQVN